MRGPYWLLLNTNDPGKTLKYFYGGGESLPYQSSSCSSSASASFFAGRLRLPHAVVATPSFHSKLPLLLYALETNKQYLVPVGYAWRSRGKGWVKVLGGPLTSTTTPSWRRKFKTLAKDEMPPQFTLWHATCCGVSWRASARVVQRVAVGKQPVVARVFPRCILPAISIRASSRARLTFRSLDLILSNGELLHEEELETKCAAPNAPCFHLLYSATILQRTLCSAAGNRPYQPSLRNAFFVGLTNPTSF